MWNPSSPSFHFSNSPYTSNIYILKHAVLFRLHIKVLPLFWLRLFLSWYLVQLPVMQCGSKLLIRGKCICSRYWPRLVRKSDQYWYQHTHLTNCTTIAAKLHSTSPFPTKAILRSAHTKLTLGSCNVGCWDHKQLLLAKNFKSTFYFCFS